MRHLGYVHLLRVGDGMAHLSSVGRFNPPVSETNGYQEIGSERDVLFVRNIQ
jgi:hypothetical protein